MSEILEALVMPVQDEAHHRQVWESLEYARRIGGYEVIAQRYATAITLLMAQLAHSRSWRPAPSAAAPVDDAEVPA